MKRIGIVSDTHGVWDEKLEIFSRVATRFGMPAILEALSWPIPLQHLNHYVRCMAILTILRFVKPFRKSNVLTVKMWMC
jgi:hypothetical protein